MNPTPTKAVAIKAVILSLAAILLLSWYTTEVADSDAYWHLATGKFIVERHELPLPDPFSFTTYLNAPGPGEEVVRDFNLTHEWLWQVVMYLAYSAAGWAGIVLLRAALMTAFVAFAGLWAWRRCHGFYRSLATASVTAFIASYFNSDRPYQITYALLVAVILILEYRRPLWLLPPLFLFWANCHGGFFLGFVVLGAYGAEALWLRLQRKPLGDERRFWTVAAVCIPAAFLNPNGFQALWVLAAYRGSTMQSSLYEWQKPALWPPSFLNLLLLVAVAVLVWNRRRARISDWLLLILFGAAYLSAVRNSNLLALVAPVVIVSYLPWKRALPVWTEYAVVLLLIAGIVVPIRDGRAFRFCSAEWKYPAGAAQFVRAHHITGPMLNTYDKGGYLIWRLWPNEKTFIDGRALSEAAWADYQQLITYGPNARRLLDKYAIQVVVMNSFEANSGTPYILPLALADPNEKEWKIVFADSGATVFMRQPPEGVQPLPSPAIFEAMEEQCKVTLDHDPARPRCARSLGRLFARLGDRARARRWTGLYLAHRTDANPADDEFYQSLP